MSVNWLPLAVCAISIVILGALIALKLDRITAEMHRYLSIVCAVVLVALGISLAWTYGEDRQAFERIANKRESIRLRTGELKKRVDANKTAVQEQRAALQEASHRLLAGEGEQVGTLMRQQDYLSVLQKDASALAAEGQALSKEIAAVHTELDALTRANESREFWRAIVMIAVMLPILGLSLHRTALRKRSIAERSAVLRARGIDPMVPSDLGKELALSGRKIQAIKVYRQETGAALAEAKAAVEAYLYREAAQHTSAG